MNRSLPDLSRFEIECLRRLWSRGDASIRDVHSDLPDPPSYSTVRKIFERLEAKGAIERVRLDGKAWVYRSRVSSSDMIRKEIRRLLDTLFDGSARPLVAHLADMDDLSLDDLKELEKRLGDDTDQTGHGEVDEK
ncbi:MAG: BlaI/MecI/CopY family transcriptional regulator [Candidatus Latescibacterota bacterium]|nr:MAG: BlaI/MecI/CopY family transcriptional regulator [Candidatus Latescibacterota bacterium]